MTKTVILEKMDFPEPVIKVAVEPKTKGDQQKMGEALVRLAAGESRHVTSLAIVMNSDGIVMKLENFYHGERSSNSTIKDGVEGFFKYYQKKTYSYLMPCGFLKLNLG